MKCITATRFNMYADVLHQGGSAPINDEYGQWVETQDPLTGDIIRVWEPATPDDPETPEDETQHYTVKCMVRGIIEGGVRAAGTTENWTDLYESVEMARMWFPANKIITKRDRIVNVRNRRGTVLWKEEESGTPGNYQATVFEVLGVTPVIDPFGNHVENYALLERVQAQ